MESGPAPPAGGRKRAFGAAVAVFVLSVLLLLFASAEREADSPADSRPPSLTTSSMISSTHVLGVPVQELLTVHGLVAAAREFWAIIGPGGRLHPQQFLEHKGHLLIEGLLLAVIVYLFLQHSFKPHAHFDEALTDKEMDQLCKEWKPEPLTRTLDKDEKVRPKTITSYEGKHVVADGARVLDLVTYNFLGLGGEQQQQDVAAATIEKYGVGSCGPRGFYGTIDVHLQLETELSEFMGTPEAIIYSYDIATITSIIPAFANRKDVLVMDECCSFPLQQGATLSRAAVRWFKHNDMADLERVLQQIDKEDAKERKPLNRRFIVVEGIYANTGELAPLDRIYTLKEKYRYRLIVEESFSFGVLGKTGRGAAEHWGLRPDQVEIMCASMGNSLGSVGGFCVGTEEVVEHQRLSGSGYCFSASLPPFLATAASQSLRQMQARGRQLLPRLQANAAALRKQLLSVPGLTVVGSAGGCDNSPVIHLRLANPPKERKQAEELLQQVADHAFEQGGVYVCVALYSDLDRQLPPPSLRIVAKAHLEEADIAKTVAALKKAAQEVL